MKHRYARMIKQMAQKKSLLKDNKDKTIWYLYVLRCCDNTFYTGITNNIERRLRMHQEGKASRYTRIRRPVELIYKEICAGRAQALACEYRLKSLSRMQKEDFIQKRLKFYVDSSNKMPIFVRLVRKT